MRKRTRNPKVQVLRVLESDREVDKLMMSLYRQIGKDPDHKIMYRALVTVGRKTGKIRGGATDEMDMVVKCRMVALKAYREMHRMNRYDSKK